ncbi:MAG: hypothetical protein LRY68_07995 [Sulfurospirillum sp.]|nr:hypothetical protein [Sulfurospirillum sp.]
MRCKFLIGTLFCLLTFHPLLANSGVDFSFFKDKPQSLAKDFYIYEYLQKESATPEEAKALFGMVHTMNLRFFHLFAKKNE